MVELEKCSHSYGAKFCPDCGQALKLDRINKHYISQNISNLLNVENGVFFTIKELILRPGKAINEFLYENRTKYIKPINFLIFTSLLFALLTFVFDTHYSYLNINKITYFKDKVSTGAVGEWLNSNIGYTNLLVGFFVALWTKALYPKTKHNFYELIVMLCFIFGEATLIMTLAIVLSHFINISIIVIIIMLLFFLYPIWAIGQFFGKTKIINYIKSVLILILGSVSYLFVSFLIGYTVKQLGH